MLALSTCRRGAVDTTSICSTDPYGQSDALVGRLANFQCDSGLLGGLGTRRLHHQGIGSSRQKREGEIAFWIGSKCPGDSLLGCLT
jgi:hypothetical protein